jgi:membrane carboxypeptidase/penicillin-binding protein
MRGGYSFNASEFNRATQAKRQPGSAFKPFIYLAALERFYKPTELILDANLVYDQCVGCKKWKPSNYTKKRYGPTPMRLGIEKSRNLMTARLAIKLIKEENSVDLYLNDGLSNLQISEKMKVDINTINLLINYIKKKKETKLIKNNNLIKEFALKYQIDEDILKNYLKIRLNINDIAKLTNLKTNVISKLISSLKTKNIIQDYALKFGINNDLPEFLSMSLGAGETDLLSLTNAYGMIVNGGKKIIPTLIDRVQNRRGKTIFNHDKRDCKNCYDISADSKLIPPIATSETREKLVSQGSAYQMVSMLKGAVDRGTGIVVKSLKRNLAGKTGTTNFNNDAWFVGFSNDLVVGVFVGFDNPRPLGLRETGSSVAAPIFRDFMKKALEGIPDIPFRRPPGIKLISVNSKTGVKANVNNKNYILEAFKPGQLPNNKYTNDFIDVNDNKEIINNLSPLY